MTDDTEYRNYYYHFGLVIVSIYESNGHVEKSYRDLTKKYICEYFRETMKIPYDFKVFVDVFESSEELKANYTGMMVNDDVVYKEYVIRCTLTLTLQDNNRLKITNPSLYEHMRDNESHFLKKFVHVI